MISVSIPLELIIIGTDQLTKFGITLNFNDLTITWEKTEVIMKARCFPMKEIILKNEFVTQPVVFRNAEKSHEILKNEFVTQPLVFRNAEKRHETILDADHSAVDIDTAVKTFTHHLKKNAKYNYKICHTTISCFSGGLGTCNIKADDLELVDEA